MTRSLPAAVDDGRRLAASGVATESRLGRRRSSVGVVSRFGNDRRVGRHRSAVRPASTASPVSAIDRRSAGSAMTTTGRLGVVDDDRRSAGVARIIEALDGRRLAEEREHLLVGQRVELPASTGAPSARRRPRRGSRRRRCPRRCCRRRPCPRRCCRRRRCPTRCCRRRPVPQTMLSPSSAVPQTMLSPSDGAPHDVVAVGGRRSRCPTRCCRRRRRAPDDVVAVGAVPQTMLSPSTGRAPHDVVAVDRRAPHDVVAVVGRAPDDVVAVAGRAPHDVVAVVVLRDAPRRADAPGVGARVSTTPPVSGGCPR